MYKKAKDSEDKIGNNLNTNDDIYGCMPIIIIILGSNTSSKFQTSSIYKIKQSELFKFDDTRDHCWRVFKT